MSGKTKRDLLKDVRSDKDFAEVCEKIWTTSGGIVKVVEVHENTWNRFYVLFHRDIVGQSVSLKACGDVTMELHHPLGVLILINDCYK